MKTKKDISDKKHTDKQTPDPFAYPPSEDIYNQGIETNLDPENPTKEKTHPIKGGKWNEKDFNEDYSGDDLDVPGAELDDEQEKIGSEDEENNYYSLGGDNHNDLEEDKG